MMVEKRFLRERQILFIPLCISSGTLIAGDRNLAQTVLGRKEKFIV